MKNKFKKSLTRLTTILLLVAMVFIPMIDVKAEGKIVIDTDYEFECTKEKCVVTSDSGIFLFNKKISSYSLVRSIANNEINSNSLIF